MCIIQGIMLCHISALIVEILYILSYIDYIKIYFIRIKLTNQIHGSLITWLIDIF